MRFTATPSANNPTWVKSVGSPLSRAAFKHAESFDSTPMILISGINCLSKIATPAAKPPPPTCTNT